MHGGLLRRSGRLALGGLLLSACQSIIGISNYQIDTELDDDSSGGGEPTPSLGGQPNEGDGEGEGGDQPSSGSGGNGTDSAGMPTVSEGGAAGDKSAECSDVAECDDTIDCTVDACDDGVCTHRADDSLCVPTPGECLKCRTAIGCVAAPAMVQQLLLDPSFDEQSGDWVEDSDSYPNIIVTEAGAQSGTNVAKLGPAPVAATEEEYGDLYQYVTIPENTSNLRLSGHYQLTPGATKPGADYVAAAFYKLSGGVLPVTKFHSWQGSSGAQAAWKSFDYTAPRDEVLAMRGQEFTFDLVLHTVGSEYRFDTLKLEATICE
jgi:hypothetical protein